MEGCAVPSAGSLGSRLGPLTLRHGLRRVCDWPSLTEAPRRRLLPPTSQWGCYLEGCINRLWSKKPPAAHPPCARPAPQGLREPLELTGRRAAKCQLIPRALAAGGSNSWEPVHVAARGSGQWEEQARAISLAHSSAGPGLAHSQWCGRFSLRVLPTPMSFQSWLDRVPLHPHAAVTDPGTTSWPGEPRWGDTAPTSTRTGGTQ